MNCASVALVIRDYASVTKPRLSIILEPIHNEATRVISVTPWSSASLIATHLPWPHFNLMVAQFFFTKVIQTHASQT